MLHLNQTNSTYRRRIHLLFHQINISVKLEGRRRIKDHRGKNVNFFFVIKKTNYIFSFLHISILRPQTVTHIPTHSQPPVATTAPPSWNNTNVLPPTTYMPTKTFIKAGTNENPKVTAGEVYDPSNSAMKLHQLAKHNNVIEIYEKVRDLCLRFTF